MFTNSLIVATKICMFFYRCNKMTKFFLKNTKNVIQNTETTNKMRQAKHGNQMT